MIYGISQSSGVERLVEVERAETGVLLIISDRIGNVERERIILSADELVSTVMDGGVSRTLTGTSPGQGTRFLDIEVRRNEVLLCSRAESESGCDAAVGLDDLQDALEGVINAA